MDITIDFTRQAKANARTELLKARENPSVDEINVIHADAERFPDMSPFERLRRDAHGKHFLSTYGRKT